MIITLVTFIMQVLKQTNFFEMTSITSTEQQVQQQLDDDGENCHTHSVHSALKMEKSLKCNVLEYFSSHHHLKKIPYNVDFQPLRRQTVRLSQIALLSNFRAHNAPSDTKWFSYSFAPGHPCSNYFHLFRKLSSFISEFSHAGCQSILGNYYDVDVVGRFQRAPTLHFN